MNQTEITDCDLPRGSAPARGRCPICDSELVRGHLPPGDAAMCPQCAVLPRWMQAISGGDLHFLSAEAVIADLEATNAEEAIREVLGSLAACGALPRDEIEGIAAALLRREALASTGIGDGVAIPHARHPAVTREIGTIAWSKEGVEFHSIDDRPVRLVVLLLSAPHRHAEHLQALATIAQHLRADQAILSLAADASG